MRRRGALITFWGFSPKDTFNTVLCLWNLLFAASLLRGLISDSYRNVAPLSTLSIMLSIIYAGSVSMQILGIAAVSLFERLRAMRTDMMLSLLAATLVLLASMIRMIVHVALDSDIISECVALAMREPLVSREGIWSTTIDQMLPLDTAVHICKIQFQNDSVHELLVLAAALLTMVLLIGATVHDNINKDREEALTDALLADYEDAEYDKMVSMESI